MEEAGDKEADTWRNESPPASPPAATAASAAPPLPSGRDLIRLNVGGTLFTTSRSTLYTHAPTFLSVLVTPGGLPTATDATGALFIDRDGTHFRHILNYLRSGTVPGVATVGAAGTGGSGHTVRGGGTPGTATTTATATATAAIRGHNGDGGGALRGGGGGRGVVCCATGLGWLAELRVEADYFGLTGLVSELDALLAAADVAATVEATAAAVAAATAIAAAANAATEAAGGGGEVNGREPRLPLLDAKRQRHGGGGSAGWSLDPVPGWPLAATAAAARVPGWCTVPPTSVAAAGMDVEAAWGGGGPPSPVSPMSLGVGGYAGGGSGSPPGGWGGWRPGGGGGVAAPGRLPWLGAPAASSAGSGRDGCGAAGCARGCVGSRNATPPRAPSPHVFSLLEDF